MVGDLPDAGVIEWHWHIADDGEDVIRKGGGGPDGGAAPTTNAETDTHTHTQTPNPALFFRLPQVERASVSVAVPNSPKCSRELGKDT
jgi:hypothetical protein